MSDIENIFELTFLNKESETTPPEEMTMRYIATSADVAKGLFIQNFHSRDWEFLSAKYLGQKDKSAGDWDCAGCGQN